MQSRRAFLGMAGAVLSATPALARRGDWTVLGTRSVNLLKDRDIIYVGFQKGLFTGLKLSVAGNGIFMERLLVRFMNDETAELTVRNFIRAGGETREILLPKVVRAIRHVDLIYRRISGGGKSQVTVFGRLA